VRLKVIKEIQHIVGEPKRPVAACSGFLKESQKQQPRHEQYK